MTAAVGAEAPARHDPPTDGRDFPRSVTPPPGPLLDTAVLEGTRDVLERAGAGQRPDAVLLSGGLDSSIAARVASGVWGLGVCVLAPGGTDRPYCETVADRLGMRLRRVELSLDELLDHVPDVTRILQSFDPMEVRNSVVQYVGLRAAAEEGASLVATGDGGDELFCGYSYMAAMAGDALSAYRRRIASTMDFAAPGLADDLGLSTWSPFLDPEVRAHALALANDALVRPWKGRTWGKWVLREAFGGALPEPVCWRWKDPLEVGAGSDGLPGLLAERTPDAALEAEAARAATADGVTIRDAEHLAYYRAYRRHNPPPRELAPGADRRCPDCRGPLPAAARFCRTCGWYGGPDPTPDPGPPDERGGEATGGQAAGGEATVGEATGDAATGADTGVDRGAGNGAGATGNLQIQGDGSTHGAAR